MIILKKFETAQKELAVFTQEFDRLSKSLELISREIAETKEMFLMAMSCLDGNPTSNVYRENEPRR